MNRMTQRRLERLLRQAPDGGDLDRAVEGVLGRAQSEGLVDVAYAAVESPFGELLVAQTDRGVVRLVLPTHRGHPISHDEALAEIAGDVSPRVLESPKRLDRVRRELDSYFEGGLHDFEVPVDWRLAGPGFRSRALHAVARIPYGVTRTYGEIAKAAGNPRAFRAAGTACGQNPVPLIVPCHRVVQSGGGVGNYGGGPEMKRALLGMEGAEL
jgi:methylated-DNA-[protein]-cysteine S-methyltransferase